MGRTTGNFSGGRSGSSGSRSASTRSSGSRSSGGSRAGFSSGRSSGHGRSSSSGSRSPYGGGGFGSTRSTPPSSRGNMGNSGPWRSGPAPMPPAPRRRWTMWGVPRYRGYGYGGGYAPSGGYGCGCLSSLLSTAVTLVVLLALFAFIAPASCASSLTGTTSSQQSVTKTTTKARPKLSSSECKPIDEWFEDLAEWIDDPSAVTSGMKTFYNKTGVQPYLIVSSNIEGDKDYDVSQVETYMRNRYDELFGNDDGHVILLFCEPYDGEYDPYLLVGLSAQEVIDVEAEDIIYDTIDRYYTDSSLSNSEYFGKVFSESATKIMATSITTTTTEPAPTPQRTTSPVLVGAAAVACGAVLAFFILRVIRGKSQA